MEQIDLLNLLEELARLIFNGFLVLIWGIGWVALQIYRLAVSTLSLPGVATNAAVGFVFFVVEVVLIVLLLQNRLRHRFEEQLRKRDEETWLPMRKEVGWAMFSYLSFVSKRLASLGAGKRLQDPLVTAPLLTNNQFNDYSEEFESFSDDLDSALDRVDRVTGTETEAAKTYYRFLAANERFKKTLTVFLVWANKTNPENAQALNALMKDNKLIFETGADWNTKVQKVPDNLDQVFGELWDATYEYLSIVNMTPTESAEDNFTLQHRKDELGVSLLEAQRSAHKLSRILIQHLPRHALPEGYAFPSSSYLDRLKPVFFLARFVRRTF